MKTIVVLSHCILNTASKVKTDESDLAEEYLVRDRLLRSIVEKNVQVIQLPCPEFILYGSRRWGHVRDQFSHPHFREESKRMLEPVFLQLEEYASYPEEYEILGIVSVEGSPSCGRSLTCSGNWGGELSDLEETEKRVRGLKMIQAPGVFMEVIQGMLAEAKLQVPILTMQETVSFLTCQNQEKEGK